MIEERVLAGDLSFLEERVLLDYVERQRWFGAKAQEVSHARILDTSILHTTPPLFVSALTEIRFGAGTHELYQLLLGFRPEHDRWDTGVVAEMDGWTAYDALADPVLARELLSLIRGDATVEAKDGQIEFRTIGTAQPPGGPAGPRPAGVEQSNTSVVFGEELILKLYRRVEAGINPELEVLRFLTQRSFPNVAALEGWYAYAGRVMDATLGVLQRFVPGARDGWELALDELARSPEAFVARLHRLGEVTGALHNALASDSSDPDFAPEEPSAEALALIVATVDEQIDSIFRDLPETEALEPIAGRGEEVRERLRIISNIGAVGRVIRHHGDYHLGQVLCSDHDWIVIDFEGEPARSLPERRRKRSPLRDVAGMLRSFAYAASAAELTRGVEVEEGWEARARSEFLGGYFDRVDRNLLPPGRDATEKLLVVFELEKAVYELRYELNNRPDWVRIPVAGILRLLNE